MKTVKKYVLSFFIFYATSVCTQSHANFFFKDISRIDKYREIIALGILQATKCKNFKELQKNKELEYKQALKNGTDFTDHKNRTFLFLLVATNNINIVRELLVKGVCFNVTNQKGINALSFLIFNAKLFGFDPMHMAELLMKHGANPTIKDHYGYNAVDYAKALGYSPLLEIFKNYGY